MPIIYVAEFRSVAGANSPADGFVAYYPAQTSLSTIRNAAVGSDANVTNSTTSAYLRSGTTTNNFSELMRGVLSFNTSSIPDDAIITSAIFNFYVNLKFNALGNDNIHLSGVSPASSSGLVVADYGAFSNTSFGSVAMSSLTQGSPGAISLNSSGLSAINLTGITSFGFRLGWDLNNSFTGTWVSNDSTNISIDSSENATPALRPYLEVTYTRDLSRTPETLDHSKLYINEGGFRPNIVKIWNGSAWVYSKPKLYTGTEWRELL